MKKINLQNAALLVIDIVNECCHKKCEEAHSHSNVRKMVPKLIKFIEKFKKYSNHPIIYIKITPWNKRHLPENLKELYKDPKKCYYSDDKTGFSSKFFMIKPNKKDIVITKNTYDAFSNPKLEKILKRRRIKTLIITGVYGDACVNATINCAFSKGYNLIMLKDLIETTNLKKAQALQKLLINYNWPVLYGDVISSKEFFKRL